MPDFSSILANVQKHISLSAEEQAYFTSVLLCRKFDASEFLLREGSDCRYLDYVVSGALRAFINGPKDRESTIMFAMPDWWITDMYCFAGAKPAMMQIEAMTESLVFRIEKNEFDRLLLKIPVFERYFRILMQNAYTREQLRMIENLSLPAIDRYRSFLERYPLAASRITQKQLASYLGISPEFLSSIKTTGKQGKS